MTGFGLGYKKVGFQQGSLLNPAPPSEIPDGAIITLDGDYIKTLDGDYIIAGTPVPNNALITISGEYIKTLNNEFIITN